MPDCVTAASTSALTGAGPTPPNGSRRPRDKALTTCWGVGRGSKPAPPMGLDADGGWFRGTWVRGEAPGRGN